MTTTFTKVSISIEIYLPLPPYPLHCVIITLVMFQSLSRFIFLCDYIAAANDQGHDRCFNLYPDTSSSATAAASRRL